jgi:hypothetical protein
MKILLSLSQRQSPARKQDQSGSFGPKEMLPALRPWANSSPNRQMAVPSAAQEEDRGDIGDTDHHDGPIYTAQSPIGNGAMTKSCCEPAYKSQKIPQRPLDHALHMIYIIQ